MKRLIFLMLVLAYSQLSFSQINYDCTLTDCNCELTIEVSNSNSDFIVEIAEIDSLEVCFETETEGTFSAILDAENASYIILFTGSVHNLEESVDVRITGCGVEVNETLSLLNLLVFFNTDGECEATCGDNEQVMANGFGCELIQNLRVDGCEVCFNFTSAATLGDIWTRILVHVNDDTEHLFGPGDGTIDPITGIEDFCFSLPGIGEHEIYFDIERVGSFHPCGQMFTLCSEEECCTNFPIPDPDEGLDCELGSFCIDCDGGVIVTGSSLASKIKIWNVGANGCMEVMGNWNGSRCELCDEYDDLPCDDIWTFPAGTVAVDNNVFIEFQATIEDNCGDGYSTDIGNSYYNLSEQYAKMMKNGTCAGGRGEGRVSVSAGDHSSSTSGVQVYPNPASDYLKITSLLDTDQSVQILNTNGQELLSRKVQQGNSTISLSGIAAGIYYVHISDENTGQKTHVQRIVILK